MTCFFLTTTAPKRRVHQGLMSTWVTNIRLRMSLLSFSTKPRFGAVAMCPLNALYILIRGL